MAVTTIRPNATLTFRDYVVQDDFSIQLRFECLDPGPGQVTDYFILISFAELQAVTTQLQLRDLVVQKLERKLRAVGIASKLDPFIGQSLVV